MSVTLTELQEIETREGVKFSLNDATGRILAEGPEAAVERTLAQIVLFRDEVAEVLRQRQGLPKPSERIIVREVSPNVPAKAIQRLNYRRWYEARTKYYWPSEEEEERMFAAIDEGDEVIFDFAHSVTVRKPSGLLVAVNRKGEVVQPSPYSPALQQK